MPRNADDTRAQLIRAAERLFAERGVDAVSLREINREADQRNATALQYHFGDRQGLIRSILAKHELMVDASRNQMLDEIEKDGKPDLGCFAAALVLPAAEKLRDFAVEPAHVGYVTLGFGCAPTTMLCSKTTLPA